MGGGRGRVGTDCGRGISRIEGLGGRKGRGDVSC
jgi:hypothetical protein